MHAMRPLKRFYKEVSVKPADSGGYAVVLDGRPLRTPARLALAVPSEPLALAITEEWRAQEDTVDVRSMPLTGMAFTAIDLVSGRRGEVISEIAAYAQIEMLCYRAEWPPDLAERQDAVWQPLLDWAAGHFGADLHTTGGILPIEQPGEALQALRAAVAGHSDMELAALATAVKAAGSLVIGLALAHSRISAEEAFAMAELETSYQIELWGEDPEATKRRASIRRDLSASERFFRLLSE